MAQFGSGLPQADSLDGEGVLLVGRIGGVGGYDHEGDAMAFSRRSAPRKILTSPACAGSLKVRVLRLFISETVSGSAEITTVEAGSIVLSSDLNVTSTKRFNKRRMLAKISCKYSSKKCL